MLQDLAVGMFATANDQVDFWLRLEKGNRAV